MSSDIKLEQDSVNVEGTLNVSKIDGLESIGAKGLLFRIVGTVTNNKVYRLIMGNFAGKYILFCDAERFTIKNPAIPNNNKVYSTIEHASNDSLIINKGNCYSGGVKIEGDLVLENDVNIQKTLKIGGVTFYHGQAVAAPDGGMASGKKQELILTPGSIQVKYDYLSMIGHPKTETKDLVDEISALRQELDELKAKLKAKGVV